MNPLKKRALLLLAPAILAIGLLAGCSSSDPATLPSSGVQVGPYSDVTSWQLAMNKCMADKGMAPQVKQAPGGGNISAPPAGVDAAAFEKAGSDCLAVVGDAPVQAPSADEQAQMQKAKLAFYKCLQDAGYDVATPPQGQPGQASSGGNLSGVPSEVVTTCGAQSGY